MLSFDQSSLPWLSARSSHSGVVTSLWSKAQLQWSSSLSSMSFISPGWAVDCSLAPLKALRHSPTLTIPSSTCLCYWRPQTSQMSCYHHTASKDATQPSSLSISSSVSFCSWTSCWPYFTRRIKSVSISQLTNFASVETPSSSKCSDNMKRKMTTRIRSNSYQSQSCSRSLKSCTRWSMVVMRKVMI